MRRRRESWVEAEGRDRRAGARRFPARASCAGLMGMALAGLTRGKLNMPGKPVRPHERIPDVWTNIIGGRISAEEIARMRQECRPRAAPRCTTR